MKVFCQFMAQWLKSHLMTIALKNVMMIGDSGAGKSETLEALGGYFSGSNKII